MSKFPNFPFRALVFGYETTITGEYRGLYVTQGYGLVTAREVAPLNTLRNRFETAQRSPRRRAQGFFSSAPLTPSEARERTLRARGWLKVALSEGPLPARDVLQSARREGISERGLRRAKKHLNVKSRKAGGKLHG